MTSSEYVSNIKGLQGLFDEVEAEKELRKRDLLRRARAGALRSFGIESEPKDWIAGVRGDWGYVIQADDKYLVALMYHDLYFTVSRILRDPKRSLFGKTNDELEHHFVNDKADLVRRLTEWGVTP